jgi:chemotaxis protein methyltransferase CheR
VADIPPALLHGYFQQGTGENAGLVKVGRSLRTLVTFRRINFLDDPWPIHTVFDCIFCRNVIIYFDRVTQTRLMQRFASYVKEDGHLFLGHSESLYGVCDRFAFLHNTIYRKIGDREPMRRAGGAGA